MGHSRLIAAPAIGFVDEGRASTYRSGLEFEPELVGRAGGERFYVGNRGLREIDTEALASPRSFQRRDDSSKPTYQNGVGEPTRNIPGVPFNTLLLFGGKRDVYFHVGRQAHEGLQEIGCKPRDCFVVWRQGDGRPFDQPLVSVRHRISDAWEGPAKYERSEAIASRRARGLLFARRRHIQAEPHIDDGSGIGWIYQTHVVRIEIAILDMQTDKPDAVRFLVAGGFDFGLHGEYEPYPFPADLDQSWHEMFEEAQAGFERECTDCPPEIEVKYEAILARTRETHRAIMRRREADHRFSGGRGRYF